MKISCEPERQFDIQIERSKVLPDICTVRITYRQVLVYFRGNMPTHDALYSAIQAIKNDGGRLLELYSALQRRRKMEEWGDAYGSSPEQLRILLSVATSDKDFRMVTYGLQKPAGPDGSDPVSGGA